VSPYERTTRWLRGQGMTVDKTEHYNHHSRTRKDLFGFLDCIALDPAGHRLIGVQVCGEDWASHVTKITGPRREAARTWILAGGIIWLVGWAKRSKGWTMRHMEITLDMVSEQQRSNWYD
jgi:hypothetical protein